jgi:hypothetical protein
MSSGSCLSTKLYDKIIKMPSKSHETIPLSRYVVVNSIFPKIQNQGTIALLRYSKLLHYRDS